MAGINETTQFIEDPEIIDLINEANSAVDKLNLVTVNEEYEKKCKKIFSELEKDLAEWGKHISKYIEKLEEFHQLEEGLKHNLIGRLDLGSTSGGIKKFESYLKQLETLLQENIKVSCGQLVSNDDLNKLKELEDEVDSIRDQLCDTNETFDEMSEENKEAMKYAQILQRAKKLVGIIDGLEDQLNKIQRKIVKDGVEKFGIEEN